MAKIVIIKLGADGDVLRTLPLAKAIKKKHMGAQLIWITKGDIKSLIEGNQFIDRLFVVPFDSGEEFEAVYNFDTSPEATELAMKLKSEKKYGFCFDSGYPTAFNKGAEYYLNTMFDDELKIKNKKTYQEMMFEVAEIPYEKERYEIVLTEKDIKYAEDFARKNNLSNKKVIGIHMGASSRWPSKAWSEKQIRALIILLKKDGYEILLFGGPNEAERHAKFADELASGGIKICQNNPENTKREFAALISLCDFVICSDSFALHLALGLGKKTIALFFVTSPDEVEGYGLLTKIVSPKLYEFFPEKSDQFNEELVDSIKAGEVIDVIKAQEK
jgi:heptosyltransferase-2